MDDAAGDRAGVRPLVEGLRERKKRLMRQLISDTATGMFLEHGFDEVRVTEIAAASGVSEKTVYNYFPTKESLLLDREESMARSIRAALGPGAPERSPIDGALEVLTADLESLRQGWDAAYGDNVDGLQLLARFTELINSTPSLRAAQRDMMDRLVIVAAEAMAQRAGVSPDDPEPMIAGYAILGLWRIQFAGLRRYAESGATADEVLSKVTDEVRRAARLIDSGLWAFTVVVSGNASRDQLRVAAESAQRAAKQVATAVRQAREAWRQAQHEHKHQDRHAVMEVHRQRQQAKREWIEQRKRRGHGIS
jgi:AcrR family transcriptional regulator